MPDAGTTFMDRPELALANLLGGGPGAAARAAIKPSTLTPHEARTPAERLGVEGLLGGVLNVVSDPLLLLALVTSFKFPIVPLKDMFSKLAPRFTAEGRKLSGILWKLRDPRANFAGTAVPEALDDIERTITSIVHNNTVDLGRSVGNYVAASGAKMSPKKWSLLSQLVEEQHLRGPYGFPGIGPVLNKSKVTAFYKADPAFKTLVGEWRKSFDGMYKEFFGTPEARKQIAEHYHRLNVWKLKEYKRRLVKDGVDPATVKRLVGQKEAAAAKNMPAIDGSDMETFFKKKRAYMPHYPVKERANVVELAEQVVGGEAKPLGLESMYMENMVKQVVEVASSSVLRRRGAMLPSLKHLDEISDFVNPEARAAIEAKLLEANAKVLAGKGAPILEYSLYADQVAPEYIHSMAATTAWTVKGNGAKILKEYERFQRTDVMRAAVLRETIIPMALGRMTPKAAQRALAWSDKMLQVSKQLDGEWGRLIPGKTRTQLKSWLVDSAEQFSRQPIGAAAQSYLYLSTLGGNPAAAARNLFQVALTTGPLVGAPAVARGIESSLRKSGKYFNARFQRGAPHETAFRMAFPEYHKSGLPTSPLVEEAVGNLLAGVHDRVAGMPLPGAITSGKAAGERAKRALMGLFGWSEGAVRIVSFEAAMAKGAKEGLKLSERIALARQVVQETQFVPSTAGMPHALAGMGHLSRQLLQFPLKYFNFATQTALRAGSGTKALGPAWGPLEGINPGTAARMYIWSDMIAELGSQVFGTDMEQSLLMGAMPSFRQGGPFAPMPVIPPILALMGAPAMDLAKSDLSMGETRRALPLLVPGGVGMARAVGFLPVAGGPEAARFLRKRYADYESPTSDGRYPVYTAEDGLIGFMTPGQLLMQGAGVPEGGRTQQVEQELVNMLISNRDRIYEMKREYVQKVTQGNIRAAQRVDGQFRQMFPTLGTIRTLLKKSDFENAHKRLEVTRLEQLLDMMPAEVRSIYAEALQMAMQGMDPEVLGLEPGALRAAPTAKKRAGMRRYRGSTGMQESGEYKQKMGPLQSKNIGGSDLSFRAPLHGFDQFAAFNTGQR